MSCSVGTQLRRWIGRENASLRIVCRYHAWVCTIRGKPDCRLPRTGRKGRSRRSWAFPSSRRRTRCATPREVCARRSRCDAESGRDIPVGGWRERRGGRVHRLVRRPAPGGATSRRPVRAGPMRPAPGGCRRRRRRRRASADRGDLGRKGPAPGVHVSRMAVRRRRFRVRRACGGQRRVTARVRAYSRRCDGRLAAPAWSRRSAHSDDAVAPRAWVARVLAAVRRIRGGAAGGPVFGLGRADAARERCRRCRTDTGVAAL